MKKRSAEVHARGKAGRGWRAARRLPGVLLPFLLGSLLSWSVRLPAAELSFNGFGTVGAAYIDKPSDWAYTRSLNQRSSDEEIRADLDSMLGAQLNYSPTSNVELVGRATVSSLSDEARLADYLDLAFVAWRPGADWNLRLGRVNLDAYLLSDHRDVGFTYPFIRPPVEFYSRMPAYLDGADIERSWVVNEVQWRGKLFTGRTSSGMGAGRLKMGPIFGMMAAREAHGLLLRITALRARSRDEIRSVEPVLQGLQQLQALPVPQVVAQAAMLEEAISARGVQTRYVAAAVAYERHSWLLALEVNRAKARDTSALNFTSGYVSIGRRFGQVSAYLMQSAAVRDYRAYQVPDWATPLMPIDPVLAQQAQALAIGATTVINKTAGHQFTTSAGLRWDVTPRLALKAQADRVHTRLDGDGLWHRADGRPGKAHVVAVAADFVF